MERIGQGVSGRKRNPKRILTSAYEYAQSGGRKPPELQTADFIKEYGAQAIYGRPMYASEVYRMNAARNVYDAFTSRKGSENWAQWAQDNPRGAELLLELERYMDELE